MSLFLNYVIVALSGLFVLSVLVSFMSGLIVRSWADRRMWLWGNIACVCLVSLMALSGLTPHEDASATNGDFSRSDTYSHCLPSADGGYSCKTFNQRDMVQKPPM